MARLVCPSCGCSFAGSDDWAQVAVSVLLPTPPAVHEAVTQVRCPRCGDVFSAADATYLESSRASGAAPPAD